MNEAYKPCLDSIPPGRWAVGVSGGADSVALLALLREQRADLSLHVVHLNHETRGPASDADAAFVADLAGQWNLPVTLARRSELEPLAPHLPANASARYRALRMRLFKQVVADHDLLGVVLAHQAEDQAETVFHRLTRGSGPAGLTGMRSDSQVGGLRILRPLLGTSRQHLRDGLRQRQIPWREDESNRSGQYARNRIRQVLDRRPDLSAHLRDLAEACLAWQTWVIRHSPELPARCRVERLASLAGPLRHESARRWLVARGVPPGEITPAVIEQLLTMATDAAAPARQHFPGKILVQRRRGELFVGSVR